MEGGGGLTFTLLSSHLYLPFSLLSPFTAMVLLLNLRSKSILELEVSRVGGIRNVVIKGVMEKVASTLVTV
jgi:hypothetical protein